MKKSISRNSDQVDYLGLMNTTQEELENQVFEWTESGDYIKKFSLYEEYTPVKTSGDTSVNS